MNVQSINPAGSVTPNENQASETVARERKQAQSESIAAPDAPETKNVQSEEILDKIKDLTEDGAYNVRFEMNNDVDRLVISLLDPETDEIVRQIPPKEIIKLAEYIREITGNLVDSTS